MSFAWELARYHTSSAGWYLIYMIHERTWDEMRWDEVRGEEHGWHETKIFVPFFRCTESSSFIVAGSTFFRSYISKGKERKYDPKTCKKHVSQVWLLPIYIDKVIIVTCVAYKSLGYIKLARRAWWIRPLFCCSFIYSVCDLYMWGMKV